MPEQSEARRERLSVKGKCMNSREDIVKNFIQKVSEIQNTKDNEGLSSAELKQIALEMGMSEDDWKKVQNK